MREAPDGLVLDFEATDEARNKVEDVIRWVRIVNDVLSRGSQSYPKISETVGSREWREEKRVFGVGFGRVGC